MPWPKSVCIARMLTRDLLAVTNLLVVFVLLLIDFNVFTVTITNNIQRAYLEQNLLFCLNAAALPCRKVQFCE